MEPAPDSRWRPVFDGCSDIRKHSLHQPRNVTTIFRLQISMVESEGLLTRPESICFSQLSCHFKNRLPSICHKSTTSNVCHGLRKHVPRPVVGTAPASSGSRLDAIHTNAKRLLIGLVESYLHRTKIVDVTYQVLAPTSRSTLET